MSIKTLRKRIALVAVSAMGFGLLTTTGASAAIGNGEFQLNSITPFCVAYEYDGTPGNIPAGVLETNDNTDELLVAPVGTLISITLNANDSLQVTGPATVSSLGAGVVATTTSTGTLVIDDTTGGTSTATLSLTAAGTVSLVAFADGTASSAFDATNDNSFSIIVGGCSTVTTYDAAKSGVNVNEFAGGVNAPDTSPTFIEASDTTAQAGNALFINIDAKNKYGLPLISKVWTAQATNGALVDLRCDAAPAGGTLSFDFDTCDGSTVHVRVDPKAAETGGSTTVTVTYNGVTFGTYELTFLGEAVKMTVIANTVGKVGVAAGSSGMAWVTLQDSAGRDVPGTIAVDGSTLGSRITSVSQLKPAVQDASTDGAGDVVGDVNDLTAALGPVKYGIVGFVCNPIAGAGTGTVTLKHTNAVTGDDITLPVTFTCAGGMDTYSISMDKASYKVGEIATLTITAKDSKGNPVHDYQMVGVTGDIVPGGGTLVKNVSNVASTSAAADRFGILSALPTGVKTYKIQMTTAGAWNVVVNLNGTTTKSATAGYTVTSGEVTNAEVLAAIVKLIASISKQIKLLQKQLKKK